MYSTLNRIVHFSYFDPNYERSGSNVTGLARAYCYLNYSNQPLPEYGPTIAYIWIKFYKNENEQIQYSEILSSYLQMIWCFWRPQNSICNNKGKAKLSLRLTDYALCHEDVWGSGCVELCILDLGTRWRWVVSITSRPLYPRGKSPGTYWVGGWVGSRTSLDDVEKNLAPIGTRTPTPRSSSP
jgi:hypothetical protein